MIREALSSALPISTARLHYWIGTASRCAIVFAFLLVFVQTSDVLPPEYFRLRLNEETHGLTFDLFSWEWSALWEKLGMEFAAPQDTLSEVQRRQLVVEWVDALGRANALRSEVQGIYSRASAQDAGEQAVAKLRELDRLRSWLREHQGLVEGILEEQVSAELEAEGFGQWGYVWPPVKIRFTELPLLLVVSARAEITRDANIDLQAGLTVAERQALEDHVDARFPTKRSLVTPIGGLSAYPAMILEHDSLVWLTDTFAHEWTHHFLVFFPLGYNYNASGQMTSINETTASIVGREVGRRVILAYYPDLAKDLPPIPPPPDHPPVRGGEIIWPDESPPDQFDFNREMRQTRLRVDELLAQGKVEEAEAYMEQRRQFFVEHGHNIRKLNQAYFAFYGSYATSPSTGNPIGGQLEWLRDQSPTLKGYLLTVASVRRYDDLLALLAEDQTGTSPP
jgi:hypothetical protein